MNQVVAYGPIESFLPFIPEYLVVLTNDQVTRLINRTSGDTCITQQDLDLLLQDGRTRKCIRAMQTDYWPCIDQDWTWYPKSEEAVWRSNKAQEILKQALSIQGNPLHKLNLIQACAQISGLDLNMLMARLELSRTSPEESLTEIFKRVKPT